MNTHLIDSSVFETAGLAENDLIGYFHAPRSTPDTETTCYFPDQSRAAPIDSVAGARADNRISRPPGSSKSGNSSLVVFADDGEKFGGWPGTFEWVFENGWLDRFFTALESNSDWLQTMTSKNIYRVTRR